MVVVLEDGKRARPLRHIVVHSPTGLSWGYGGSGPTDLAISLLADYFGERPSRVQKAMRLFVHQSRAVDLAHLFVEDFVSEWGEAWELPASRIGQWLVDRGLGGGE
jgi:hypothetical protein